VLYTSPLPPHSKLAEALAAASAQPTASSASRKSSQDNAGSGSVGGQVAYVSAGPSLVPLWACLASGFATGLTLIWCIAWPLLCLFFPSRYISQVVMDDLYMFLGLTLLPIAMMLSMESFYSRNRLQFTKSGLRSLGVARMAGTIVALMVLRYSYFDRIMELQKGER